jgi:methionyl-tRNA formyltransferase
MRIVFMGTPEFALLTLAGILAAGDEVAAATVMRMEEGLDTGPVCREARVAIGADMTAGELHDLLATRGAETMVAALVDLERGTLSCRPQATVGVTYAPKIDKSETRLDFTRAAREVHNRVRGLSPAPGAWIEIAREGKAERVKVLRTQVAEGEGPPGTVLDDTLAIACGEGAVRVLEVQRSGKRPMTAAEFLRGFPLVPGMRLR